MGVVKQSEVVSGRAYMHMFSFARSMSFGCASLSALLVRIYLQWRRPQFNSWDGKIRWRRNRLPNSSILGFAFGSAGKESACNVGDLGSIPGLGRFPWRRERLSTPVFWLGEFHGLYSPWGHKESDTTEQLSLSFLS